MRRSPLFPVASAHNELVGGLVMARLMAQSRLAPGSRRAFLASDRALRLAAAVRVVARGHGDAANMRLATQPAALAGLAERLVLVFGIADLADGGMTGKQ